MERGSGGLGRGQGEKPIDIDPTATPCGKDFVPSGGVNANTFSQTAGAAVSFGFACDLDLLMAFGGARTAYPVEKAWYLFGERRLADAGRINHYGQEAVGDAAPLVGRLARRTAAGKGAAKQFAGHGQPRALVGSEGQDGAVRRNDRVAWIGCGTPLRVQQQATA